jgi:predicted dehydrogenase
MNQATNVSSRREFIKTTGRVAAVTTLAGMTVPYVHAQGSETLQVALIGCGGRGTGAAANAMDVKQTPVKLVAMADVFSERLNSSYDALVAKYADRMDVPPEHKFIGFDGYAHAMDCLRPGDIAIFTTPLAFRWVHFTRAIEKGLNVFMEKPLTADGPSSRRMLRLAEQATAKNLKVGVGLMSRHHRPLEQLAQRAHEGQLGDIIMLRGYRMQGPVASFRSKKWPGSPTELLWQISRFHSFIWASGGCFNDFNIHIIDHLCWIKGSWPVSCQALGGRHYRNDADGHPYVDQNLDTYTVEYTFDDGAKMFFEGRCIEGCDDLYSSYIHGSKGMAIGSSNGDYGDKSSIFRGQKPSHSEVVWTSEIPPGEENPYENEWVSLVDAIRNNKPYNEVPRGIAATNTCNMGRMAAHTGQRISYDDALNHQDVYAPGIENFTMTSPPPLKSNQDGLYPVPMPGITVHHEYQVG